MKLFEYDDQVPYLLGEAHRRPALRLDLPALTWHLAFWPDLDVDDRAATDIAAFRERRNTWSRQLNTMVLALQTPDFGWRWEDAKWFDQFDLEDDSGLLPTHVVDSGRVQDAQRPVKRHQYAIGFQIVWRGLRGVAHFVREVEFTTLSVTLFLAERPQASAAASVPPLDQSAATDEETRLLMEKAASFDPAALSELYQRVRQQYAEPAQSSAPGAPPTYFPAPSMAQEAAMAADAEQLYEAVWAAFQLDLARAIAGSSLRIKPEAQDADASRTPATPLPGKVFADIRGCSIVDDGPIVAEHDRRKTPLRMKNEEARKFLNRYRPFASAALEDVTYREREFIANRLLGGRAVFVSTLGSIRRRDLRKIGGDSRVSEAEMKKFDQFDEKNSRFMIVFPEAPSRAQFGRLIERFLAVETLRLAALRDLRIIREAGRGTRMLGRQLDEIEAKRVTSELPESLQEIAETVERISDDVAALGESAVGRLSYRISRSGFYAEAFRNRLQEFRIKPIETWQPYDEFVRRRVFQAFDYIARVGQRREALQRRVGSQLAMVQTAALARNTEQLVRLTRHLNNLQRKATAAVTATDTLTYVASIVGFGTLGATAAESLGIEGIETLLGSIGAPWINGALLGGALGVAFGVTFAVVHFTIVNLLRWRRNVREQREIAAEEEHFLSARRGRDSASR